MSLPLSRECGAVLDRAREFASSSRREMSTADVLLAMFEVPNQAGTLLGDRAVTKERLRQELSRSPAGEGQRLERVYERSRRLASAARSEAVTSLHLLAALIRENSSDAYLMLEGCGIDIGAIRTAVMSYATSSRPLPRRQSKASLPYVGQRTEAALSRRAKKVDEEATSPIGFHPSLGVGSTNLSDDCEVTTQGEKSKPGNARGRDNDSKADRRESDEGRRARSERRERKPKKLTDSGAIEALRETGTGLALDNHPGINRGGRPRHRRSREIQSRPREEPGRQEEKIDEENRSRRAEAYEEAQKTTQDLATRLFSAAGEQAQESADFLEEEIEREPASIGRSERLFDEELADEYGLDEELFPYLVKYGRNLTVEAALGRIDPVIGRDEEIATLIDVLGKRRSNNPLLVGEPGVGKTAIVEGLARRMVEMAGQDGARSRKRLIELEMGRLLSGTQLRGAFSERLLGLKEEVADAEGEVIVFLDEIHTWMGAGAGGDGGDASGELKTALARGRFPCIGATTHDECRTFVESDPAFERRFQKVVVDEPDEETALRVVEGVRTHYERHHGVTFTPGALAAAVTLSVRYIHDRQLPDKAIGVIDLAGSRAARQDEAAVDRDAVARVVADMASIPAERLTGSESRRFLEMEKHLSKGLVGHGENVRIIAELLRRNYAGFRSQRPIGSLLFLGPTGVGKTEMVKVLADVLFHDRDAMVRIDMSEFMEAHSVSRLIGAPPGYVGHDKGGQLTEAVRQRPYQVVLLDEIEKAHPDVSNLLLQLFDEGRLTDGRGRQVDFSNTLVVMTSNVGAKVFDEEKADRNGGIGFSRSRPVVTRARRDEDRLRREALDAARDHFTPELWNRIDERLVFLPLSRQEIADIAVLQLADSQKRLMAESNIELDYEPALIDHLIENGGYDPKLGARPMRQTIQRLVEGEVAREILAGRIGEGGRAVVDVQGEKIVVRAG